MSRCRRAGGAGDAFQLVVVLFPGGGTGFWRHAADALAQPGSTVDGFPDDVRLPGVPREVLDRVYEQGVQRRVPAVLHATAQLCVVVLVPVQVVLAGERPVKHLAEVHVIDCRAVLDQAEQVSAAAAGRCARMTSDGSTAVTSRSGVPWSLIACAAFHYP